jgi:hypothetical protein
MIPWSACRSERGLPDSTFASAAAPAAVLRAYHTEAGRRMVPPRLRRSTRAVRRQRMNSPPKLAISAAKINETVLITLMSGLMAGPAVSL